jgi:hypothetical protein
VPERHLQVDHPGELVQLDCFCIGRLAGTRGTVWQDTAIDVASAYAWATLTTADRSPRLTASRIASASARWAARSRCEEANSRTHAGACSIGRATRFLPAFTTAHQRVSHNSGAHGPLAGSTRSRRPAARVESYRECGEIATILGDALRACFGRGAGGQLQ